MSKTQTVAIGDGLVVSCGVDIKDGKAVVNEAHAITFKNGSILSESNRPVISSSYTVASKNSFVKNWDVA